MFQHGSQTVEEWLEGFHSRLKAPHLLYYCLDPKSKEIEENKAGKYKRQTQVHLIWEDAQFE